MTSKKMLCFLFALVFFGSMLCVPVSAIPVGTTYYVDSLGGSDENSGLSPSDAFASTTKASSLIFTEGDKILFKRGCVFGGNFVAKGSGTHEAPVTLGAYGDGARPILSSARDDDPILLLSDVSNWTVSDIEITSPNGTGLLVSFSNTVVENIVISNVVLHDIKNYAPEDSYSGQRAAVRITGGAAVSGAHIENLLMYKCEIYNCAYGISTGGNFPDTSERPYNKNIVVDSCNIHDIWDDAFIMRVTDTIVLRNSAVINACKSSGIHYTAPVWMWGVTNGLVENCEIAGASNELDGMAVDFDDHTDNSTYQYIYSHDNTRFMINCPYESDDHFNNTVRYCLSVNDNRGENGGGFSTPERGFKFYNNTIVNGSTFYLKIYGEDTLFMNNIFSLIPGETFDIKNMTPTLSNNCYYGVLPPRADKSSFIAVPQFAGTDETKPESFILKACSPCIGAGIQVEENMGEHDFYGNPLTAKHNIGCYEGAGVDGAPEEHSILKAVVRVLTGIARQVKAMLNKAIERITKQIDKVF